MFLLIDAELEHSGEDPFNPTAKSSRPKRKAKSMTTANLSTNKGSIYYLIDISSRFSFVFSYFYF